MGAPTATSTTTTSESKTLADGRQTSRVENYTAFWEKDSSKDTDAQQKHRLENYTDVINGQSPPTYATYHILMILYRLLRRRH